MDIVVTDEEFISVAQSIKEFGEKMEDAMGKYITCMNKLATEGFSAGEASNSIREFISSISSLKWDISGITTCVSTECSKYIENLDVADDFLYE